MHCKKMLAVTGAIAFLLMDVIPSLAQYCPWPGYYPRPDYERRRDSDGTRCVTPVAVCPLVGHGIGSKMPLIGQAAGASMVSLYPERRSAHGPRRRRIGQKVCGL